MTEKPSKDVLELSYREMQERLAYRIEERNRQRGAAIRTFTASLLFISLVTAVISTFPQKTLIQYGREPITGITDILGPFIASFGAILIFASIFTSLFAIREIPQSPVEEFSSTVPHVVSSDFQRIGVQTSETTVYPRESEEDWFRGVATEYANVLDQARMKSQRSWSEQMVNLSYLLISFGSFLVLVGVWLSVI